MPLGPSVAGDKQFAACSAYAPAYQVTDDFMRTFNTKDAAAWGATFNFPSVRIASGNVRIINSAADLEQSFPALEATGWHHSAWEKRQIVQCGDVKAHMLTTFVRYRADGSVLRNSTASTLSNSRTAAGASPPGQASRPDGVDPFLSWRRQVRRGCGAL